jgi:hypothetical protein
MQSAYIIGWGHTRFGKPDAIDRQAPDKVA